ncbi:hypothetical protein C7S20_19390 [Christiangramia fulva]|uniref:VRR-NUC domain-containing protein n=1 Tax=Christiangramia fulva TaxID=2126553 RepID=A0A2R3ZAE8_9FLAO|nr:hypothetical protein [Christiangramia fulva]AVR47241.1 hypothetical protein C7S20_19390 [Christiangramia fulva]
MGIKKQPEYELQKAICRYLDVQYPRAIYLSDTVASVKLKIPQQMRNKAIQKSGVKIPDLLILEPRGAFSGLFIELKVDTPFKKNGELKAGDHLAGQMQTIKDLKQRGYYSCFSWGFEMTRTLIDRYFALADKN